MAATWLLSEAAISSADCPPGRAAAFEARRQPTAGRRCEREGHPERVTLHQLERPAFVAEGESAGDLRVVRDLRVEQRGDLRRRFATC